jgi:hypothetical protein
MEKLAARRELWFETNSKYQSRSWEAGSHSASQKIPNLLWNPKVHYRIHKIPPQGPIQFTPWKG